MPKVSQLSVRGLKSIEALDALNLRSLNVLIGANGAGKSNFLGLFQMASEVVQGRLQAYVQKQGGPDALLFRTRRITSRLRVELRFADSGYRFSLIPTEDNRLIFEREEMLIEQDPAEIWMLLAEAHRETAALQSDYPTFSAFVAGPMAKWHVYHFPDTSEQAALKQPQSVRDNLQLKPDGANLAPFLRFLRERHTGHYKKIIDTIRLVAPFFEDFVYRKDGEPSVQLEWCQRSDPGTPLGPHQLSDGTLRFICLVTLLLQPAELGSLPRDLVIIDEPELGLHPYAINVLCELLKQASETQQVIVSTQSVEVVNCFDPEDVLVVDRKDEASTFKRLSSEELGDWLKDYSLGELWKQNVLGGRPA